MSKAWVFAGLMGAAALTLTGCGEAGPGKPGGAKPAPETSYADPGFVFVKDKFLLSPETIEKVCLSQGLSGVTAEIFIKPEYIPALQAMAGANTGNAMGFFDGNEILYSGPNQGPFGEAENELRFLASPEDPEGLATVLGFENPGACPAANK